MNSDMTAIYKRRKLKFALRSVFLAIAALSFPLGLLVNSAHKQERAVVEVLRAGGKVAYAHQVSAGPQDRHLYFYQIPLNARAAPPGPEWLRRIVGDQYFIKVVAVWLPSRPSERVLEYLQYLPHLIFVDAGSSEIANADVTLLSKAASIEELHLTSTPLTDDGIACLRPLSHVRILDLYGTHVTSAGIMALKPDILSHDGLVTLDVLDLGCTDVSDDVIDTLLNNFHELARVNVGGTSVTEEARVRLRKEWPNCIVHPDP